MEIPGRGRRSFGLRNPGSEAQSRVSNPRRRSSPTAEVGGRRGNGVRVCWPLAPASLVCRRRGFTFSCAETPTP